MDNFLGAVLIAVVGLCVGLSFGLSATRSSIASDCKKLGGFYVASSTFKCAEVKHD